MKKVICPHCNASVRPGNFCEICGEKMVDICDCWVKKMPYNCNKEKCPGQSLVIEEMKAATEAKSTALRPLQ